MSNVSFCENAHVYLHGEKALEFVASDSDACTFRVNGFSQEIIIKDRRKGIRKAVEAYFSTHQPELFYKIFNCPAFLELSEEPSGAVRICLREPQGSAPELYLWIAIGIENSIPVYPYVYWKHAAMGADRYAFLSLFTIEPEPRTAPEQVPAAADLRGRR